MVEVNTLSKQLLFCTVRLTQKTADGGEYYGTGFIFNGLSMAEFRASADGLAPEVLMLVTNRHLLEDTTTLTIEFLVRAPSGSLLLGEVERFQFRGNPIAFYAHPDDDIDIAVLPLGPAVQTLQRQGRTPFYTGIRWTELPTADAGARFDAIEELTFIGYPDGIADPVHHTPIVRQAISATPISLDYGGDPVFLVDGSVFQGSSGSPVFVLNLGIHRRPGGLTVGDRLYLVGILAETMVRENDDPMRDAGERFEASEDLHDVARRPFVRTAQALNLGVVFNAGAIVATINVALAAMGEPPGDGEQD